MGNTFTCVEEHHWDSHAEISAPYPGWADKVDDGAAAGVHQDMTLPLSSYFISSGHNSYLTGDQLLAKSGIETIVRCLRLGCRVIELDVYNKDSANPEPICKHGGTLTKPVAFRACVRAIKEHAFVRSPYPVIITMENHTNKENQAMLATILQTELGGSLFVPDAADAKATWKSPQELQRKILLRTSIKPDADPTFKSLIYIINCKFKSLGESIKSPCVTSSSFGEEKLPKVPEYQADFDEQEAKEDKFKLQKALKVKAPRMPASDLASGPSDCSDVKISGSLQEVLRYTRRHLMRVYPAGWRVDSSNYNPMIAWARGASLAALNWQSWGKPLWLNQALFSLNGNCGYVLKPDYMRNPAITLPAREPKVLRVTVHSAYKYQGNAMFCMRDDLFVQAEVVGMPMDTKHMTTKTIINSGRLRAEQTFDFAVSFPEMAIFSLQLRDEDADSKLHLDADDIGHFTIPLSHIRSGSYKLRLLPAHRHASNTVHPERKMWVKVDILWEGEGAGQAALKKAAAAGSPPDVNARQDAGPVRAPAVEAAAAAAPAAAEAAKAAAAAAAAAEEAAGVQPAAEGMPPAAAAAAKDHNEVVGAEHAEQASAADASNPLFKGPA